jgi:hypothetical protein
MRYNSARIGAAWGNGSAERRLTELRKSDFMDPENLVSNEKGPALGESSWFKLLPQV